MYVWTVSQFHSAVTRKEQLVYFNNGSDVICLGEAEVGGEQRVGRRWSQTSCCSRHPPVVDQTSSRRELRRRTRLLKRTEKLKFGGWRRRGIATIRHVEWTCFIKVNVSIPVFRDDYSKLNMFQLGFWNSAAFCWMSVTFGVNVTLIVGSVMLQCPCSILTSELTDTTVSS